MKTTKSRKKKIVQSQQILYKCHICEKDFEQYEFKHHIGNCTKNDVAQGDPHGLNTISEDKEQHKCLICDKNFDTEQNLDSIYLQYVKKSEKNTNLTNFTLKIKLFSSDRKSVNICQIEINQIMEMERNTSTLRFR